MSEEIIGIRVPKIGEQNIDPSRTFEVEKNKVWVSLQAEVAEPYYKTIEEELAGGAVDSAARQGLEQTLSRKGAPRTAEGIIHSPEKPNGTLLIFTPGLPGDSNVWFENKHMPLLLEKGYTVLALRHLGTKMQSGIFADDAKTIDKSSVYIHCEKRRGIEEQIGGGREEHTLEEMALEGAVAVNALGQDFEDIKFVSHSAGALHTLYAISSGAIDEKHLSKVSSLVNLSGYIGGDDEAYRTFTPEAYYRWSRQFISMGDENINVALVQQMFKSIYENRSQFPKQAMVVSVNPSNDEYVTLAGAENFQHVLRRGLVIADDTQSKEVYGGEVHDLGNLQPETLLKFVEMQYPKAKHNVSLGSGTPFASRKEK